MAGRRGASVGPASGHLRSSRPPWQLGSHDFRQLSDEELLRHDDDGVLDYIRVARRAGRPGEARRALKLLVLRNIKDVRRRVAMKVSREAVDDVTQEAMISAIGAAFVGESVGEFRSWLNTIVSRRIADHHRGHEGDPDTTTLPEEHEGDEDVWGRTPESREADANEMEVRLAIGELVEELSESHQVVVVLYCYMQWPAAEAAEETNRRIPDAGMTENNVQQIGSRFRKALRKRLGGGDTPEGS
jgi:RNA polymerase sigma factor (sigma-70 family)